MFEHSVEIQMNGGMWNVQVNQHSTMGRRPKEQILLNHAEKKNSHRHGDNGLTMIFSL